jgi:hypothetical protein
VLAAACAMGAGSSDEGDTGDDGDGPGGTPSPGGSGSECEETVSLKVEVLTFPPDLLFALDRSSSMGEPLTPGGFDPKWDVVIDALADVVDTYRGRILPGLMLVPSMGDTCGPGVVDIEPDIDSDKNFVQYLEDVFPGGGTPVHTSLQNAIEYFQGTSPNPNGRYVLLTTDGLPGCGYDSPTQALTESLEAVRDLRDMGVNTYVLGYALDEDAADVLDDMAAAGGTGSYYPATSAQALISVLDDITYELSQVACEYELDNGPAAAADLVVKIGGKNVPHSPDHSNGFDYDPESHMLSFWGSACEDLRTSGDAQISANYCGVVD